MKEADKPAFIEALNEFGIIWGRDITPELVNVYWKYLNKMDRLGFDYAVKYIGDHEKFFPAPSAFVQAERKRWG